jgi:monovalent cation/hydrogen antiporter
MRREPELLLLVLMVAVGAQSVLAGTVRVPYPILLVLGGLVLRFLPGVPPAELPRDLVLVLFLPPLLYQAAFFSSPRDLRADTRAITLLAVGLVLATMSAVAAVAHTLPSEVMEVAFSHRPLAQVVRPLPECPDRSWSPRLPAT